jgi:glycosyltransferase involved in cell wall biosynthesis
MTRARPVRVLVDATALPENRGGVGRYVDELVERLPALGVEVFAACQPRDADRYATWLDVEHVEVAPRWAGRPAPRLLWEQEGLPLVARRVRPDVVHSPHYTMPLATSPQRDIANVVTIHDATFFSHPELHLGVKARFFAAWTRISARRADALIVPSAATRDEVVAHVRANRDEISVVPHGVDHNRFRPADPDAVARAREVVGVRPGKDYVAFLGTLEPRKNVPALVRAFGLVASSRPDPPVLVLAGGRGWDEGLDTALGGLPPGLDVLRPGFVPDHLVPGLLSGAQVVAYPSIGEGFGLPVLEAMACGAAVLTTAGLSLPEVGGDAVAYAASPADTDLADALKQLLDDPDLRSRLGAAGVERARGFSWERTAREHVAVYESLTTTASRA